MRTCDEVHAGARDGHAFSNGTEFYEWSGNWCDNCQNPVEVAWRQYEDGKRKNPLKDYPGGCPILQVLVLGDKIPAELMEQEGRPFGDAFHCIEFRGPDDGGGGGNEPTPQPEPTNMEGLFDRPERGVRMLKPYTTVNHEVHA